MPEITSKLQNNYVKQYNKLQIIYGKKGAPVQSFAMGCISEHNMNEISYSTYRFKQLYKQALFSEIEKRLADRMKATRK